MNVVSWLTATLVLATAFPAFAQMPLAAVPTSLSQLLAEAEMNNPQISAADHSLQAARHIVPQVTALPDPKFTYKQFGVGSPKPFAGYTNSNFAYIGVGASQELPYPGKLRLRGEVAERDADTKMAEIGVTKTGVADAVKSDYLQIAYLQQTLGILRQNEAVLDQLIHDATVHYQVGQGMQQDVLQAQVDRTQMVKEITMNREQMGQVEAHLKSLLNRDQDSADIVAEDLTENPLKRTSGELLAMVRQSNPQIQVDASSVQRQETQLASEAAEKRAESQQTLNTHLQQQLADVQQEYVKATSDEELLKEYREGLIPQSDAAYRATLSSYASNREEFIHVLVYFTDILNLKLQCAQTLADHEAALAHLESLTGATLR
jgi:outer membrane protein TolC